MSLGSLVHTVENDIKTGVENAVNWLTDVAETHVPAVIAEAKRLAASPVVQAIEAAVLTPAEEAWVTKIISEMPSLRSQPAASAEVPPEATAEAAPAEGAQSAA